MVVGRRRLCRKRRLRDPHRRSVRRGGHLPRQPLDPAGRKRALRMSMHAQRFLPVHWMPAPAVVDAARAAGRRILALEDHGTSVPWATNLCGPLLLMIGGERDGLSRALLERCDGIVRVPMAGFVPSYNLQAAMAAVAVERLRQETGSAPARD
ncbi:MAG: TrmH family RNA methyltransferase [Myxococcota bacterium]|nr:TrmH family RNA methyltransferase [Myxococcota bacterium]